jgi:hypothetical protein
VAAARKDEDCGAGCFFFWREIEGDGGVVDILDVIVFCFFGFISSVLEAGGAVWPEGDLAGGVLGVGGDDGEDEGDGEE